ncbi:hypothetical protein [Neobacillus bataviensis]|uniref:hypothetical protein n=1 Tax=Neobacillus bataviensis TaxID=220685 RepID=UPI001CBB8089|nr:hypothetical protein [Neobacillus bataviensis]
MKVVYDTSFDWNEWFVIVSIIGLNVIIFVLPKVFPLIEGIAYYLFGIFFVTFFDHTTSVSPWDLYDVNDKSSYEVMDFFTYVMNGPYSYFFVYFYKRLRIKGFYIIMYIFIWSGFSVLIEWVGLKIGLYHYEKGYKMYWSFTIYMIVQTILLIYFSLSSTTNNKING